MGKLIERILRPKDREQTSHPDPETLALMAEGGLEKAERDKVLAHLAGCPECYEIFSMTLAEVPLARAKTSSFTFAPRTLMAMAATLLVCVLAAYLAFFKGPDGRTLTASLTLDGEIHSILIQTPPGELDRDSAAAMAQILRDRGVDVAGSETVILETPYQASKSLFGPSHNLIVRVEEGVIRLKVVVSQE